MEQGHLKAGKIGVLALLGAGTMAIAVAPQAERNEAGSQAAGADIYARHCAACHGPDLGGAVPPNVGPALRGETFVAKWGSRSPAALLDYTRQTMPLNDPGSLDAASYAAIVNFVRGANKMPLDAAGAADDPARASTQARAAAHSGNAYGAVAIDPNDQHYRAARDRVAAVASRLTPVTDDALAQPADGDWTAWRRSQGTSGFSPLRQIDRSNVNQLSLSWSLSLGTGTNALAPLVHDGVMFLDSNGTVRALDAQNGETIWEFARPATTTRIPANQARGIALYADSVIVPTMDNHVLALDAKTGKLRWDHQIGKDGDQIQLTAAPLIANGKIIQGVAGCSGAGYPGGCFIVALDAVTGNELWRFNTIARPGEPGGESWNGAPLERRFGASVWTTGSYDAELNLVYFGTGQTYIISPLFKAGAPKNTTRDALFTDTTLALNPDTGKLVWHYQHASGDVWDLDWAFERTLATVRGPNGPRKIVVTAGKAGVIDALDAKTGRYLWSRDLGLQNIFIAIDPKTGHKTTDPKLMPERGTLKLVCPSTMGARNWPTSALDPSTNILYFPMVENCMGFGLAKDDASNPTYRFFGEFTQDRRVRPGSDGNFGRIAAVDLNTSRVMWTNRYRAPQINGLLTTGGGLLFAGGRDRWFRALDSSTGAALWQTRLDNVPNGFPLSFMAGGRQYVAVVSGGGTPLDLFLKSYTPEIPSVGAAKTLMVFALPEVQAKH